MLLRPSDTITRRLSSSIRSVTPTSGGTPGIAPRWSAPWQAARSCVNARWPWVATLPSIWLPPPPPPALACGRILHVVQSEQGHLVDAGDEYETPLRIGSGRAPVRPALIAGHRDAVAVEHVRVEYPALRALAVLRLAHALLERFVLLRRQQPRVHVVFRERLPRERRRASSGTAAWATTARTAPRSCPPDAPRSATAARPVTRSNT